MGSEHGLTPGYIASLLIEGIKNGDDRCMTLAGLWSDSDTQREDPVIVLGRVLAGDYSTSTPELAERLHFVLIDHGMALGYDVDQVVASAELLKTCDANRVSLRESLRVNGLRIVTDHDTGS
jgi:hypothetical protein